ncbi:hypothetical protein MA16_Dca022282 [Dendrobium catenatum]|uniref:Uncharacterized protein n=1 Tax=Dendrobium catenatum TaxID=906689 RepID=A0A2I0XB95_9ASPA|nr:hypothetical protein MA16_Dca022282 [Dendrobium catenatum]
MVEAESSFSGYKPTSYVSSLHQLQFTRKGGKRKLGRVDRLRLERGAKVGKGRSRAGGRRSSAAFAMRVRIQEKRPLRILWRAWAAYLCVERISVWGRG